MEDETFEGGANTVSLLQARSNFIEFGACEENMRKYVREPFESEKYGID